MKPVPVFGRGFSDEVENLMLIGDADGERELLEGIESTSVQEKLVDADFINPSGPGFEDIFDESDMALPA